MSLKPGFLGFRFLLDHQILITVTVFSSVCVCVCVSQVVFDRDYSDFNHLTKRRSINVHLKETKKKNPSAFLSSATPSRQINKRSIQMSPRIHAGRMPGGGGGGNLR